MMPVTTAVRDASRQGGGISQVALAVHRGLRSMDGDRHQILVGLGGEPPPAGQLQILPSGRGAQKTLLGRGPGIVHVHGLWTPFEWRVCRAARAAGNLVVCSPHGALEPWAFASKAMKKKLAWWLYQRNDLASSDLIIVNSEQELHQLRALDLRGPIAVIANGIDLSECPADIRDGAIGPGERVVLFLGRIDAKKGIPDLLRAWQAVPDKRDHELCIHGFGPPEYELEIKVAIDAMALSDNTRLLPPLFGVDKWRRYATAAVFVLPSYSENFGITVAEALFCGLPVITTHATPWSDLAQLGVGWIVPNEHHALRDALVASLALSNSQRRDLVQRAHRYASERFIWEPLVEQYRETYAWLCDQMASRPVWVDV